MFIQQTVWTIVFTSYANVMHYFACHPESTALFSGQLNDLARICVVATCLICAGQGHNTSGKSKKSKHYSHEHDKVLVLLVLAMFVLLMGVIIFYPLYQVVLGYAQRNREAQDNIDKQDTDAVANSVYVTSDSRYHLKNCPLLLGNEKTMTVDKARSMGFQPCGICHPHKK